VSEDRTPQEAYGHWKEKWFQRHEKLIEIARDELGLEEYPEDPDKQQAYHDRMAELKSSDEELQRAERKRDEVLEELIEENAPHDSEADKIRCIKREIPHITNSRLAEFLGLSQNYVTKFRPTLQGDVIRSDIPQSVREKVRKRDGDACVRCGESSELRLHHINPVLRCEKGECHVPENLATLCEGCHHLAHEDGSDVVLTYDSTDGFWEWVNEGGESSRTSP